MNNSSRLLERIKKEEISPTPKWYFITKEWSIWIAFLVSIVLGGLAFSVILFSIQQTDFVLWNHLSHSTVELLLGILPFFWLISLFLFLCFAFFSIQNSKKGYKFSSSRMVGLSTFMSILLGTIFFIGGGAGVLEDTFATNISLYEGLEKKKTKLWSMPEEGYLSGNIEKIEGNNLILKDSKGKLWSIDFENSFVASVVELIEGERIKVVGKLIDKNTFLADELRPWGGRKRRMKKSAK